MKQINVNKRTLEALYPPMDERFEHNMRAMIDTLPRRREKRRTAIKPRYALAIALLLVLIAVTALAAYVVTNGFFAEVAQLHNHAGAYDNWMLEEKESIVLSMKEYGVLQDTSDWDKALAIRSDKRREEALDALFAERYGIDGRTDVITAFGIVEKEIGMFDSEWSLERKAEYSQLMLELDLLGYDENIYLLPGDDDISQEEAIRIGKEAVISARGLEKDALDAYLINLYYQVHRKEMGVKAPYYVVEMMGPGQTYWAYVSGEGRVLSSADGYKGVISPVEEAAHLAAETAAQEIPMTERFASHVAELELLNTQVYTRENRIADGIIALSDGAVVVYGRTSSAYMVYDGAFLECISEEGQTRWLFALPQEAGGEKLIFDGVMEMENGELLAVLERRQAGKERQSIEYIRHDQLRIGPNGELTERKELQTIGELTGAGKARFDQMYAVAGHDGMLVSGYMGGKNIPAYAQLDEKGEARFAWSFEELLGYAPYLKVIDEGYVLCAWNEAANVPILRFYDKQGQLVREGESDPALEGFRINHVLSCGNGEMMASSNFMKDGQWMLARIDDDGRLLDKQVYEDESVAIALTTEIAQVNGRYVYAASHNLDENDWTDHTALIISGEGGEIREYSMQGADEFSDRIGYLHIAPMGEDKAALAYTTMDSREKLTMQLAVVTIPE